jgi:hypothetical protein
VILESGFTALQEIQFETGVKVPHISQGVNVLVPLYALPYALDRSCLTFSRAVSHSDIEPPFLPKAVLDKGKIARLEDW